jgi:hypothetical protein
VPIDVQVIFVLGLPSRQNKSAFIHLAVLQDTSFSRLFSWFACDAEGGMTYSYRNATMGSTRIALRAGTHDAATTTIVSNAAADR